MAVLAAGRGEPMYAGRNLDGLDFADWAVAASGGDAEAMERLLEGFRPYLLAIAGRDLPDELLGKVGASDLVQDTLLEGYLDFAQFVGDRPEDLGAWLRGILKNNLADCARRFRESGKRAIDRERSIHAEAAGVVDPNPTPGAYAVAQEEADALDAGLERLPEDERAVILYRNRDHLPFDEIGRRLSRSSDAARKLWARAIVRLRRLLELGGSSEPGHGPSTEAGAPSVIHPVGGSSSHGERRSGGCETGGGGPGRIPGVASRV